MKKLLLRTSLVLLLFGGAYAAYAWLTHSDLVTLNVRNMEVRQVVKKIESQTRASILVHSNVQGRVTLNVRRMPLEDVLEIVGEQTFARWSSLYPLYSNGKSLSRLEMSLRGEMDPAQNGWTNLLGRSFGRDGFRGGPGGFGGGPGGFGGGGPFGDPGRGSNQLVSLLIEGKDVQFASLALNRFALAHIVPEDGASGIVTLRLKQAKIPVAVSQLAKKAHLSWTRLYTLTGFGGFDRGRPEFASRGPGRGEGGPDDGDRRRSDWENMTSEERDERRKQRETLEEELKQTLPAEEQAKLAEQQQQREQLRQELSNMTPEQRMERFSQMRGPNGSGGRDQRMVNNINNTTPEQRVDRYRRMEERRQRWQQQGGGQGGGRGFGR
jgi:hypothetical protein